MVAHRLDHHLEKDRFNRLVRQGRAEAAIELAQETYESAVEVKDERLIGMAVLDLGYAFVLAGRGREVLSVLKKCLAACSDPYFCSRLSQTLAAHYRLLKEPDVAKHEEYSRQSYAYAERSGNTWARVLARYEMGLAFAAAKSFWGAQEFFADSLSLQVDHCTSRPALILAALGLSQSQNGDIASGVRSLCKSVALARSKESPGYELHPRLYLADAMLEMRRPRDAELHLHIALQLDRVVSVGSPIEPQILHLLGDALKMQRRSREAFNTFQKLQARFYPHEEGLAEILMDVEARHRIQVL